MARYIEANERTKRDYTYYLRDAKGQDHKSIDKALGAIRRFEESTKFKPFKKFNRLQASAFKDYLARAKNTRTGNPLGITTVDATLRLVQSFFHWLVSQAGFKRVLTYADVEYFNNTMKSKRAAHASRPIPYPTMDQCAHAFQAMPDTTEFDKRDKALFAFLMLTCARDGAIASLKIRHVDIAQGLVFQDGREVKTKNAKTFRTRFYPVDSAYGRCLSDWMTFLCKDKLFGPDDALFPKAKIGVVAGKGFTNIGLDREGYGGSAKLNTIIKGAFASVQMPQYTPHSLRKTLALLGNDKCKTPEQLKAWSMNMGHSNLATMINSYVPVSEERQLEILGAMAETS